MARIPSHSMSRITFLVGGAAFLAAALLLARDQISEAIAVLLVGRAEAEVAQPRAEGFWHPAAPYSIERASAEERARLVSLPYLGARVAAPEALRHGVIRLDVERVQPGLNLYVSGHGPEAVLMDLEGRVLHRWRYPFERAFPHARPTSDTGFFRRARLFPDGRLVALYQTGGLVFLDEGSRLLGRCQGNFYNDFRLAGANEIWTIAKQVEGDGTEGGRLDDFLVELRYRDDGTSCEEVRRISVAGAFTRSSYAELLPSQSATGDVFHTNAVVPLGEMEASSPPAFEPGNLLISLREMDVIAVIDPDRETVVWAQRGPWEAQHEPSLLDSGRILLFDNRTRRSDGSRLLEVEPTSGTVAWSWSGDPRPSFWSPIGGACSRLSNGNTLVTESVPGRAFELDADGEIVWEFVSPHRKGPKDGLVAMLFDVQRLPIGRWSGVRP